VGRHAIEDEVDHGLAARMLGLPGFRVLAVGEVGGELGLEVLVETTEAVTRCRR
jgi:hypothetical protein